MVSAVDDAPLRAQGPVAGVDNNAPAPLLPEASVMFADADVDDARRALFADLYRKSESRVALLFADDGGYDYNAIRTLVRPTPHQHVPPPTTDHAPIREPPLKKAKRAINEDDYDDEDEDDEDDRGAGANGSASAAAATAAGPPHQLLSPSKTGSSPIDSVGSPDKQHPGRPSKDNGSTITSAPTSFSSIQTQRLLAGGAGTPTPARAGTPTLAKTSEDVRKELEEARNATEEAARRSFYTLFYTLENDRTAMLEQQRLEESEKQIQAEMEKNGANGGNGGQGPNHGTLSSANLGASSLTLKHLIARIDMKRDQVKATDAELRSLINEVRKNRSKWANEDQIGQEELYEALEKVLSELKAHTEYSTPFLQRVNKREAPDYHLIVKHPMDLGTMTKKLKGLQFRSKLEFVADLNLVWDNCLKYNGDQGHPLRRMANAMRKEAEKLIPLIPDLIIRSRAEVEAEERRKQNGGDDDGGEDSDDEPIMSSRGRKTGSKGVAAKSRSAGSAPSGSGSGGGGSGSTAGDHQKESTPSVMGDQKPVLQLNGLLAKGGREGSEFGDSNGFGTPSNAPAGSLTPGGFHGGHGGDAMDMDGASSISGMAALNRALNDAEEQAYEDEEDKVWKQVTKKDRARIAKQRYDLFLKDNKLNVDEPALLRSRSGMRWYLKGVAEAESMGILGPGHRGNAGGGGSSGSSGGSGGSGGGGGGRNSAPGSGKDGLLAKAGTAETTLAEGMADDAGEVIPDYYEPTAFVPDIPLRLQWVEDDEGQVINQNEEFLRLVPRGHFVAPVGKLSKRIETNMRQIQETRKVCSKIGVVKQMQIQTQIYQNQFQRYDPEPFHEADIEPHFISGDGPFIAGETSRAALQRSVAKIFFHAGFEELQPSAMDAMTDIAADYFAKLCHTFTVYNEAEKKEAHGSWAARGARFQPRYTPEEVVLHTLNENGHDIESLDAYAREDVERLGTKLSTIHERMKAHLSDLLRPALQDGGTEAFQDGSEQFVGGDFAEELGEDFFGFKALGLDRELGLDILSVPLHLLQTRVRSQHAVDAPAGVPSEALFGALEALEPVTTANITDEIGLVKNFFLAKLHANGDQPLVEDEDLPVKQRRPRPRLGATGKIVSPQKRPPKEQIALAKRKKRELAAAVAAAAAAGGGGGGGGGAGGGTAGPTMAAGGGGTPAKKLKTGVATSVPVPNLQYNRPRLTNGTSNGADGGAEMERVGSTQSQGNGSQGDDKDDGGGLMSPESIER